MKKASLALWIFLLWGGAELAIAQDSADPQDSILEAQDSSESMQAQDSEAQTTGEEIKSVNLGRVEVVGRTIDENSTVSVIEAQDLVDTNTKDLAEALRYTSGVDYEPASGTRGESSFSIRGYGQGDVGIFVDGIPMYSIYDKQTDWGQFTIFDAEEIQISKGYTSVLYGPNTMGGAINLVTKKPKDKLEIDLKAQWQSPNQHMEYVSVGTNLGVFYAQFSFGQILRDYYNLSRSFQTTANQPTRHRVNSYYTNRRFNLKLGVTPNSTDEYSLNVTYQMGDKGGTMSTISNTRWWDWPHYDKLTAYFLSKTVFADFVTLNTRIYYDTFYNELVMRGTWSNGALTSSGFRGISLYDDYTIGGVFGLDFNFTPQDVLKLSASVKSDNHYNHNYDLDRVYSGDFDVNTDITTYVSGEYTHKFSDSIRLALSGSYTINHVLKMINGGAKDNPDNPLQGWGAQAILYVDILDNLDTYITAGQKANVPTLKDRYSETWGYRVPNPSLQVETALNFEVGLNYYPIDELHLSLAVFYNDMTNMLVSVDMPDGSCSYGSDCVQLRNVSSGYSTGFEVGLEYMLHKTLTLLANYSYIQKRALDSSGVVDITDYSNHLAKFRAKYSPIEDIDFVLGMRYSSKRIVDQATLAESPSVFLTDIRFAYRPSFLKGLEVALGVDNLFDNNYWYSEGYELAGRTFYVEASYKF